MVHKGSRVHVDIYLMLKICGITEVDHSSTLTFEIHCINCLLNLKKKKKNLVFIHDDRHRQFDKWPQTSSSATPQRAKIKGRRARRAATV